MAIIIGIVFIAILVIATIFIRLFIDPFNFFEGLGVGIKVSIGVVILFVIAVAVGIIQISNIPFLIVIPGLLIYPIAMGIMAVVSFFSVEVSPRVDVLKSMAASIKGDKKFKALDSNTFLNLTTNEVVFVYQGDESITSFIIPDNVTIIGANAFENCKKLQTIIIPNGVTNIGYKAFFFCTSLTSVVLPNSVKNIESHAFSNCESLTSITIPDSVTHIDALAFFNSKLIPKESMQRIKEINRKARF